MKNMLNYIKKDPLNILIIIISIAILIFGSMSINFIIVLLIIVGLNLIWLIPYLNQENILNLNTFDFKYQKAKTKMKIKNNKEIKNFKKKGENNMKKINAKHAAIKNLGKKTKSKKKKIILGVLIFLIACLILGIIFFIFIAITAPKFDPDKLYTKEASIMYDNNGDTIAKLGTEMRQKIKFNNMSEELVDAIVATEDSRFFQHNGFDLLRFVKASFGQLLGSNAGGASTITMQVSKNQYTSTTSSGLAGIKRKFTDIFVSVFQIERNYSKKEIFEFYANSYYLGNGAYGVEQAAENYFNKKAKDLNLSEAAMIAGLFQSPSSYDPYLNPKAAEARRLIVLKLMKRHGYITDEQYKKAKAMTVSTLLNSDGKNKSYGNYQGFIDTVAADVEDVTGDDPYSVSMKIYTTMDKEKQNAVNDIMSGKTFSWANNKVDTGIAAINVKTGAVVAVGASRNSTGAKSFNNATMIKRQIGSTAKPLYDYGPAVEYNGISPYQPVIDAAYSYSDGTKINNWDSQYRGIMTAREALRQSRNIPALKIFQSVENSKVLSFVQSLGLSPEVSNGKIHEAHAIGGYNGESPLSLAAAYAAFANGGYYIKPYTFTKIEYDNGKEYKHKTKKKRVMSEATAYIIADMLKSTASYALGNYQNINGAIFGAKTGTSNFDEATMKAHHLPSNAVNDLWVAGISPDYSITLWYGYEKVSSTTYNTMGSGQQNKLFQTVAKNFFKANSTWKQPTTVKSVTVESSNAIALLPSANTPDSMKITELFREDYVPTETSKRFDTLGNVSNAKGSISGNNVTISWSGIGTPDYLNSGSSTITEMVKKAFSYSSADQRSYANYMVSATQSYLGSLQYKVYLKEGSSLSLAGSTGNTSITLALPTGSSATYVITSGYSNSTLCQSSGVEVKVSYSEIKDPTTSTATTNSCSDLKSKSECVAFNGTWDETSQKCTCTQ